MQRCILIVALLVASWVPLRTTAAYERLVKRSPYPALHPRHRDKASLRPLALGPYAPAKTLVVRTATGTVHANRLPGFDVRMSRGVLERYVKGAGQRPPKDLAALRALARRIAQQRNG